MTMDIKNRSFLTRFAWLSIAAAVVTIALKSTAYLLTGSVGLLSDAMESLVNLMGALMALAMLTIAARPADEEHSFGHSKAEYFSSGFEGITDSDCCGEYCFHGGAAFIKPSATGTAGTRFAGFRGGFIGQFGCGVGFKPGC